VSVVCETKITYLLADITGYFNEKSFPAVNNAGTENQTQQPTKRKTNKQKTKRNHKPSNCAHVQ